MKMKLAFLLGLLSVTMVMGKMAEFAEMAKMTEMAEDSRDQLRREGERYPSKRDADPGQVTVTDTIEGFGFFGFGNSNLAKRAAAERMNEEDAMEKRASAMRPTTAPPMTTTTPTMAPPKVPGDSSKEFKLWGLFKCDGEWKSSENKTCEDYQRNEWCKQNGDYGDGWELETYSFYDDWADNFGRPALVCPQCGCGKYGEYDQFFVIWEKADTSEKAKEMCEARDAKLANVIPRNGDNTYTHRWSAERKLLKRFLEIQSKAFKNLIKKDSDIDHYWVGTNLKMLIYRGNDTDSKKESGHILFRDQNSWGLPVCRIRQADFDH